MDNKNGKTYQDVGKPTFSPDSRHVSYAAWRAGKMMVVTDGVEGEVFSDSKRAAYVFRRGGEAFVALDGSEGKPYEEIQDLQFTADSKHLVYAAQRDGKLVVVVDGIESKEYDDFVSGASLVLDGARTIGMVVTRGREILRVDIEIAE